MLASASLLKSICRITASGARSWTNRAREAASAPGAVVTWALGQWLVT